MQIEAALGQRFADAGRSQHILKWFARPDVEMHVAGGHQRNGSEGADLAKPMKPHLVIKYPQLLDAEPTSSQEIVEQPLCDGLELGGLAHALR